MTHIAPIPPFDEIGAAYVQGLLCLRAGQYQEAESWFGLVLTQDPRHEGAHRNLVRALLARGCFAEVILRAGHALSVLPEDAGLHYALGTALRGIGKAAEAAEMLCRAVALEPGHAAAWLNLGNACVDLDDLVTAETCCRTAIHLNPGFPEALSSLGYLLTVRGHLPEAIEACEAAIAVQSDCIQAHWNLATVALLSGDLRRGFQEYEWRKRHDRFRRDFVDLPGPVWDGGDPEGRTILVQAEQGFGDTIQFARFLPLIVALGGRVVLACDRRVAPLISSMPHVRVVSKGGPLPEYDAWIDQMSLPRAFGCTLGTIPSAGGYLAADPALLRAWRARLPLGRKVGLVWSGNPLHSNDRRRSIPTDCLTRLVEGGGAQFVSLQPEGALPGVMDISDGLTNYAQTAAAIAALDLVITVDTSVAHLAGAMGVPVWIMLPHAPDWRWLLGRDDTPWYRSARLFRQDKPNDWAGVIERVEAALALKIVPHRVS